MKLNNRGWGLGVFLGFVFLLFLCIIVAGVNAYKLGLSKDSPEHYFDKEIPVTPNESPDSTASSGHSTADKEAIINAAMRYKNELYPNLSTGDNVIVSFKSLLDQNYLSLTGTCSGYVDIRNENQDIHYNVYFHCPDYTTAGYNPEFDQELQ